MADALKVLGQSAPSATTLTDLYTVPGATSATVSSIIICNRGSSSTTFRVAVAVAGAANEDKQYIYMDIPIPAKDTFIATLGLTLAATDKVRVFAGNANLSFNLYGVEVT